MSAAYRGESPYKGLMPYAEEDAAYFFGRDAEREILTSNLLSARLTLLYGPSGVGKSSVLRAGVIPALRRRARQNLLRRGAPEFAVAYFNAWRDDPLSGLTAAVEAAVAAALGAPLPLAGGEPGWPQALQAWAARVDGDLLLLLDQFEEYFLYHRQEQGNDTFSVWLPRLVADGAWRVNVLISIREDALARLDYFEGKIPRLFDNFIRIEHLDDGAAREAIYKPIQQYNRVHPDQPPVEIEPGLVDAVLKELGSGRVTLTQGGHGQVEEGEREARVETPFLQLVMTRLWDQEMATGTRVLRGETLHRLGGAEHIVRTHLDETMSALSPDEQDTAARLFRYLVTPSRTKIAHTSRDLAEYAGRTLADIEPTLEKLARSDIRILRPVPPPLDQPEAPRYEIFHDVLAAAVLDWRTRYVQRQEQIEAEQRLAAERVAVEARLAQEKRRVGRLRLALLGVSLLLLTVVALALYAFQQRDAASRATAESAAQQKINAARELAATAATQMTFDPQLALALAVEGLGIAPTAQGEQALRLLLMNPARAVLRGHSDTVNGAVFSYDGRWLATFSDDRTVQVWEFKTLRRVAVLKHEDRALGAAFSPDSAFLLTTDGGTVARVWDVTTGLARFQVESASPLTAVAWSPDGRWIAAASEARLGSVLVAQAGSGQVEAEISQGGVAWLGFSPDGTALMAAGEDGVARLWETASGKMLKTLEGHTGTITTAAFRRDGKQVVTGSADKTARVWDAATGKTVRELDGFTEPVHSVAIGDDGRRVLAASAEDTALLWDLSGSEPPLKLEGHTGRVNRATFSRDGKLVLTAGNDQTARVWDAITGAEIQTLRGHDQEVTFAAFSLDGRSIVTTSSDETVRLWELDLAPVPLELVGHRSGVRSVAFSRDGKLVLTGANDGTARLWDASTGQVIREFKPDLPAGKSVTLLAGFGPGDEWIVTAGDRARIWEASTGQLLYEFEQPGFVFAAATVSADRRYLAGIVVPETDAVLGLGSGRVRVWQVGARAAPVEIPQGSWEGVLALSPDSQGLLVPGPENTAVIRNLATGQARIELRGHAYFVWDVTYSPDGRLVATGSGDGTARVWDAATGTLVAELRGHPYGVTQVAFSPDSKLVLTRGNCSGSTSTSKACDTTIRVWEARTGRGVTEIKGVAQALITSSFSPDGRLVITVGNDRLARVWDAATGAPAVVLQGAQEYLATAAFAPDDRMVVTGGADGLARLYACPVCGPAGDLLALARARLSRALTCEERQAYLNDATPCEQSSTKK